MTGYRLEIGYISGYSFQGSEEEAWALMRDYALRLCDDPGPILTELEAAGRAHLFPRKMLQEVSECYRKRADMTITFHEKDKDFPCPCIRQAASGGEPGRMVKEEFRRAFCRCVIHEMHRRGIEVNLIVA